MGGSEAWERGKGGGGKEKREKKRGRKEGGEGERSGEARVGEIQEAIFEEKIFRIFFTQKKVFFLASQYKTGLYLDLLLENRIQIEK